MRGGRHALTSRLLLMLLAAGAGSCATPTALPAPVPPAPIDLSPRCEPVLDGLEAGAPLAAPREPRVSLQRLPGGARWLSVSSEAAPLDVLAWGFPAQGAHVRLAAALLQAGETAADPRGLRDALLDLGASLSAEIENDWLWLELRFPPARRDASLRVFARWLDVQAPEHEAFERIRRGVSLATLAEQASATLQAERLFRRLHPAEGEALESDAPPRDADPDRVIEDLRRTLRPESSLILHVSSGGDEAARAVRERGVGWIGRWPVAAPPSTPPGAPAKAVAPLASEPGAIHVIDRPGSPQVELLAGFRTVAADHPDASALQMLASLLGSDVGGRLFRDLRERQGLAYIIDALQEPDGRFVVTTRARPERIAALLAGVEAHLRALVAEPLLPCEVRMLVDRMTGEAALTADDATKLMGRWRSDLARRRDPAPLSERLASYRAAADGGLEVVARRYLAGRPTVVLVGDAKWLRRDLGRAFSGRPLRVYDAALEPDR